MAAKKRHAAERYRDLAFIAELELQGLNSQQIADRLNARVNDPDSGIHYTLSRKTIERDMKEVHARYLEQSNMAVEIYIAQQHKRLLRRARMYEDAWDRSKQDAERNKVVKTAGGDGDAAIITEDETQNSVGDIRFLQGAERQDDKIAKLFGLDAPTKIAFTDPKGRKQADPPTDEGRARVLLGLIGGLVGKDEKDDGGGEVSA